jgi:hypothetical protein
MAPYVVRQANVEDAILPNMLYERRKGVVTISKPALRIYYRTQQVRTKTYLSTKEIASSVAFHWAE